MTLVKVCGMRDLEHMAAAAEAGADLLGMVFLPTVRRYIPPETGAALASTFRERRQGAPQRLVGLFADQPVEHVNAVAAQVGLDFVQLCGSESPEYWAQVEPAILKVVHVPAAASGDTDDQYAVVETVEVRLQAISNAGHIALLDRQSSVQPGGMGEMFDWSVAQELAALGYRFILAGGLTPENVAAAIEAVGPFGVDGLQRRRDRWRQGHRKDTPLCGSGRTRSPPMNNEERLPNAQGRFGDYGGRFVPETLMAAVEELRIGYEEARDDPSFQAELAELLATYVGRPTPLTFAANLTKHFGGARVYLKREDLAHTGAHKINHAVGQALLAKRMGKQRIIAETGAGQHGVATATVCRPCWAWSAWSTWAQRTCGGSSRTSTEWS